MAELFRKAAFHTMTTPEQLDKQVKIMRPSTWVLYVAMIMGLITFGIWSFTYKMSNGIDMSGVIFTNSNIVNHTADRSCLVTDVLVNEGEYVDVGDIIAVVSNEELLDEIVQMRYEISLLQEGTKEYDRLQEDIEKTIDAYVASTIVKSSSSGYIQTVKSPGRALSAGDSVAMVISDSGYEEVIAYVPLHTANNLTLGMTAQISPSYAEREEYGYMTGVITGISDTPVSEESIIAKMGTFSYVEDILPEQSCVEVRIRLDLDENSANKYKWSNSKGEKLRVELGTQCEIIVVTKEYFPIELLFGK